MNGFLDGALVGGVLIASVGYALYSLGPRAWRRRWLEGAAALAARLPAPLRARGWAERLARTATAKAGGACGGCDNCGSDAAPAASAKNSEIRISVSRIGKRR